MKQLEKNLMENEQFSFTLHKNQKKLERKRIK